MTTKTETLLALCEAAQTEKQTFYDGPLDWSDQRQALAYEATPAEIRRMVEVMLQLYEGLLVHIALTRPIDTSSKAIAAFDAWQKGGE